MRNEALGIIETVGYIGVVEAIDAMTKAADVRYIGHRTASSGVMTLLVRGDIGSVKAAVDAGIIAVRKIGKLEAHHVIPRPHQETELAIQKSFIRK